MKHDSYQNWPAPLIEQTIFQPVILPQSLLKTLETLHGAQHGVYVWCSGAMVCRDARSYRCLAI